MRYYSKKDWWLGLIIWVPVIFSFTSTIKDYLRDISSLVPVVIFTLVLGFIGWIWFNTYYEFKEDFLLVVCGPIREKIYFNEIKGMKETRNPLSSSALSLDRIEILRKRGFTLISPKDKEDFIKRIEEKGLTVKRR